MNRDALSKTFSESPRRLLLHLAELAEKNAATLKESFRARIFLASGLVIDGRLLRSFQEDRADYLILATGEDPEDPGMCYISLDHVAAVEFTPASSLIQAASAQSRVESLGPAPTRLELKRDLEKFNQKLSADKSPLVECDWPTLGDSDAERLSLKAMFSAIPAALKEIVRDPMGAAALGAVSKLIVRGGRGPVLTLTRDGDAVSLECALGQPALMALDLPLEIKKRLEAVL